MVDQKKLNGASPYARGADIDDGESVSPSGALANGSAEFLHDLVTLAELQFQLVTIDARQGFTSLIAPIGGLLGGIVLALGCVPIALATIALVLTEETGLSPARSFALVVGVGGLLSLLMTVTCYWLLKRCLQMFSRSQREWRQNIRWFKETLRRVRQRPAESGVWPLHR